MLHSLKTVSPKGVIPLPLNLASDKSQEKKMQPDSLPNIIETATSLVVVSLKFLLKYLELDL